VKMVTLKIGALIVLLAAMIAPGLRVQRSASVAAAADSVHHFSPAVTTASPAPTQEELEAVKSKSASALNFLDNYWKRVFDANRWEFRAPRAMMVGEGHAWYRSAAHTIYFNPAFFVERMRDAAQQTRTDGDMAFIIILAHEYGHAVQAQLGLLGGPTIQRELQADRLAGAFAKAAGDARLLEPGDLDEATYTFFTGRDETGADQNDPQAHGTGTQRINAFHVGLRGGVNAALQR